MFVTTVTIQMFRIFHGDMVFVSIALIISLLSDIQCLSVTYMSLKETELQRQRLEMLYDFRYTSPNCFSKVLHQPV